MQPPTPPEMATNSDYFTRYRPVCASCGVRATLYSFHTFYGCRCEEPMTVCSACYDGDWDFWYRRPCFFHRVNVDRILSETQINRDDGSTATVTTRIVTPKG